MSFVYVGSLTSPTFDAEYRYAPDLSLATQVERTINNVVVRRTHYVGSLEWTDRNPGGAANREARLSLPGGLILVRKFIEGQLPVTNHRYMFFDALGSVDVIASETGAVIERMSFDLHGRRRSEADWTTPVTYGLDATTRRGYTGHEQVDGAGLIHMRARMYDPQLGRFIQPDPMVDADATQGWNRYSYVMNNPLSATDPTGMLTRRQAIRGGRIVAAVIVSYFAPQLGVWAGTAFEGFGAYVVSGFIAGGIAGGWQGAIAGAFSAGTFRGIGLTFPGAKGLSWAEAIKTPEYWHKVLAHAVAGGVLNTLQGGKFGHGFASNGFTGVTSPAIAELDNDYLRTFTAVVASGTISDITGGKFANGAVTEAFAQAFSRAAAGGGETAEDRMLASVEYDPNTALAYEPAAGRAIERMQMSLARGDMSEAQFRSFLGTMGSVGAYGAISLAGPAIGGGARFLFAARGGQHIFYTGGEAGLMSALGAERMGRGATIFSTIVGSRLSPSSRLWGPVSAMFALTSRSATVYVGPVVSSTSTWMRWELPMLRLIGVKPVQYIAPLP